MEYRHGSMFPVKERYALLDAAVHAAEPNAPVIFKEVDHVSEAFENNVQRLRFWEGMTLSVPVDLLKFSPGGSSLTVHCLMQADPNRSNTQMLTDGAKMLHLCKSALSEHHTREMKRLFKRRIQNVASIQPNVIDFLYTQLAMDRSAANHPVTQQRLQMMFHGEPGLIADLRHLNPGRPSDYFDVFFEKLKSISERQAAADDRRHGVVAHMSSWTSMEDCVQQAADECPEGTPIPSKACVRLQFAPTNVYTKVALSFTSRVPIQRKIQRRQLRASHEDDHYCAAAFRYLKYRAIELGGEE